MPASATARRFNPLVILLVIAALGALAWWLWPSDSQPKSAQGPRSGGLSGPAAGGRPFGPSSLPTPVRVGEVRTGTFAIELKALGTVTASQTVEVKSRVAGELMEIRFREGQKVNKGDVLAVIDPRPYQVALQKAKGDLAQLNAQLNNAKTDLKRYRGLFSQDSIAKQTLDSQAALVEQYSGNLLSQQAQVAAAELDLTYTKIVAPIAGRLGLRQLDVGNLVAANDSAALVSITQVVPIDVVFTLPEAELPQVLAPMRTGATLKVQAFDRGEQNLLAEGVLHSLDNQIDLATGTVKLKTRFANAEHTLFPNQFVNVRVGVNELKDALLLPSSALQYGTKGTFVYVVGDDQKIIVKPVEVGSGNSEVTWLKAGVVAGDKVVLEGTDRLRDGSAVEVIEAGQ